MAERRNDDERALDTNVLIRVTTEERERWREAARHEGETLSSWVRRLAGKAADRVLARAAKGRKR